MPGGAWTDSAARRCGPGTGVLPWHLREALQRAAATPVTPTDPQARRRAVDEAIRRARLQAPEYFSSEVIECE